MASLNVPLRDLMKIYLIYKFIDILFHIRLIFFSPSLKHSYWLEVKVEIIIREKQIIFHNSSRKQYLAGINNQIQLQINSFESEHTQVKTSIKFNPPFLCSPISKTFKHLKKNREKTREREGEGKGERQRDLKLVKYVCL